jgi:hypothetical protein
MEAHPVVRNSPSRSLVRMNPLEQVATNPCVLCSRDPGVCAGCRGTGLERRGRVRRWVFRQDTPPCAACDGVGNCKRCDGSGHHAQPRGSSGPSSYPGYQSRPEGYPSYQDWPRH